MESAILVHHQIDPGCKYMGFRLGALYGTPHLAPKGGEWRLFGIQIKQKSAERRMLTGWVNARDGTRIFPQIESLRGAFDFLLIACDHYAHAFNLSVQCGDDKGNRTPGFADRVLIPAWK